MINRTAATLCWILLLLLVPPVAAQEARLPDGLDQDTRAAVEEEIALAEEAGISARPLILKVLEGRSKGATGEQIVAAVRSLRERLEVAASVLGAGRTDDVLLAAAGALYAGAEATTLEALTRDTRDDALGMAFIVLGDLLRRGVPVSSASDAVVSMGAAGVDAPTLSDFRRKVDEDIRTGLAPARATEVRLRGVLARIGGGRDVEW